MTQVCFFQSQSLAENASDVETAITETSPVEDTQIKSTTDVQSEPNTHSLFTVSDEIEPTVQTADKPVKTDKDEGPSNEENQEDSSDESTARYKRQNFASILGFEDEPTSKPDDDDAEEEEDEEEEDEDDGDDYFSSFTDLIDQLFF